MLEKVTENIAKYADKQRSPRQTGVKTFDSVLFKEDKHTQRGQ